MRSVVAIAQRALGLNLVVREESFYVGIREFSRALEGSDDDYQSAERFWKRPIAYFERASGSTPRLNPTSLFAGCHGADA